MATLLIVLYICAMAFLVYNFIDNLREIKRIDKEYGRCHALEKKRVAKLPKKFKKVNKYMVVDIMRYICRYASLPYIDELNLGWRATSGSTAGLYQVYVSIHDPRDYKLTSISIRGFKKFKIDILIHELTHHKEFLSNRCVDQHGDSFLESENQFFDMLEAGIASGIWG